MVTATAGLSLGSVRLPVLVVVLAGAGGIAPAQDPGVELQGRTITRIVFDPAEQPYPPAALEKILPIHAGDRLELEGVHAAIEKLYATGRYSNVSIDGRADGGVVLTVSTEQAYFISGVSIEGVSEPPTRGQLESAAKLELGARFSEGELKQATEHIEERLRANGLYQAKVSWRVDRYPATEEVFIHFHIDSGERARFDGIQLSGNFKKPERNIVDDTHWRRGIWLIHLPGWRQVTE